MVGGGAEGGLRDPVSCSSSSLGHPSSSWILILPIPSRGEIWLQALRRKGPVEPTSPSPGFYSCMFVVTQASRGWRPIIDISTVNDSVAISKFRREIAQSVPRSGRRSDWMVTMDLKDAYLQIPNLSAELEVF